MSKSRRKTVQSHHALSEDPQVALEQMLTLIAKGGKAAKLRRDAANLAATYDGFDPLPLSEDGLLVLLDDRHVARTAISKIALQKAMGRWPLIHIMSVAVREFGEPHNEPVDKAAQLFLKSADLIADDALFISALETDPIQSYAMEALLIAVRNAMLRNPAMLEDDATMRIAVAMARQVDLNEGVWTSDVADAELRRALPAGAGPINALLHAVYGDFSEIESMEPDASYLASFNQWVEDRIAARAQFSNHNIASVGRLSNAVSIKVADQYGAAPYPRWTSLSVPAPGSRLAMARALSPDNRLRGVNRPDVLIAGCGTGHHAAAAALGYGPKAAVLGVDLSGPSLDYASGMAQIFNAKSLSFAQMDLLDVGRLARSFDIIESIGVLHHTADPFKSWTALMSVLKPGGIMAIGVYSAAARAGLSRFRAAQDLTDAAPSDDLIRTIRHRILNDPQTDFERSIARSADFH
ncbi:MAG: SAM-dependent methyltransferase, partial [Alphaproteobacteria bacterium]